MKTNATSADDAVPAPHRPPHLEIAAMASAIWKARAVYAMAQLSLADLIADGRHSAEELAATTRMHVGALSRLLRALAGCGLLTEAEPRRFALTPLGAALKAGAPGAARATVLTLAGDWQWKAWDNFLHSVATGEPGLQRAFGLSLFEYLAANLQDGADFNGAMVGLHGTDGPALATAYDFAPLRTLADLGGGTGTLLAAVLQAHPHLRGTLVDLPETVPVARRIIESRGLSQRCKVVAGDFFKMVPPGYDAYILAHVLHDWADERALPILRNCRRALPPHGRLLIVDAVLPQGDAPHPGKLMDLLMLTVTGGVERTAEEFAMLLQAGGFEMRRIIPICGGQSVVEATPV
jgi:ubiquinone/menaquinone biosynthesis C-methylase UbiE